MAKATIRKRTTIAILALTLGAVVPGQSAAQSNSSCKQVEGDWLDALNDVGGTSGTVTNAGILNGATETVYDPAFVFTLDPNVVSYLAETTITTNHGQLKTSNVYMYNFVTGVGAAMGTINPDGSTGEFVGATGVLYFNTTQTIGAFPDQSYVSTIAGEVCFADQ